MEIAVRHTTVGKKLHLGALIRNAATADFGMSREDAERLATCIQEHVQTANFITFDDGLMDTCPESCSVDGKNVKVVRR